jgi:glutathione S-transferase
MITLYGFGRVHPGMIGEARDMRVQWPLFEMTMIDIGMRGKAAREGRATLVKEAGRWFDGLERRLDGREWIACDKFTVADILLATVLLVRRVHGRRHSPGHRLAGSPQHRSHAAVSAAKSLLRPGHCSPCVAAYAEALCAAAGRERCGHSLRVSTVSVPHFTRTHPCH